MTEFKRTITIQDKEHFDAAMEFSRVNCDAGGRGLRNCLEQLLLRGYDADELVLRKDSVPNSFDFAMRRNGGLVFNGGIICHGQGVETFSMELCPAQGVHFSIHT